MAIDDILAAIRSDAEREIALVRRAAAKTRRAIAAAAEDAARRVEGEARARADEEAVREAEREERALRRALEGEHRALRERVFASLFEELDVRLAAARERGDYAILLRRLWADALAALPTARRAHVDPRDRELATALASASGLELVADLHTAGGVVLDDGLGSRAINTLEARRAAGGDALRTLAAQLEPTLAGRGHAR